MSRKPAPAANHLRAWRERMKYTQPGLAQKIRDNGEAIASTQSISNLERGERRVSTDWLEKIAQVYGIEAGMLLQDPAQYSNEDVDFTRSKSVASNHTARRSSTSSENYSIAELEVRAGMGVGESDPLMIVQTNGNGHTETTHAIKDMWELPRSYLREISADNDDVRIIEVWGDSMEPTLSSGDRVMVNTRDTYPRPGGVFALWDGRGVSVKRLELVGYGEKKKKLRIISDNPRHGTDEVDPADVHIAGRVIWCARRM